MGHVPAFMARGVALVEAGGREFRFAGVVDKGGVRGLLLGVGRAGGGGASGVAP